MNTVNFACNGASVRGRRNVLRLDYLGDAERRVRLALPRFVNDLLHLPDNVLDLLEVAAYVHAGDRSTLRGRLDALEYDAWARGMNFHIRVRRPDFWNGGANLGLLLSEALNWMTGDAKYSFFFQPGHATLPANLFDAAQVPLPTTDHHAAIMPFSGGLDSLAGALWLLTETNQSVVLISHRSNPRTKKTQDALVRGLREMFSGRILHYAFECTLSGVRGKEETQRSRSFLYTAIAASIALSRNANRIYVFENGVTSLNFARRQDLMNARASRTTHPQTLGRLSRFFSAFASAEFRIETPFLWKTKADVLDIVATSAPHLVSSAVSCTATFRSSGQSTHCGECFQCIDRRMAAYARGHESLDHPGLYAVDAVLEAFTSRQSQTTAIDYLRQAAEFQQSDATDFELRHLKALGDVVDWLPDSGTEIERLEEVHKLLSRYGNQVRDALVRIRDEVEDPFSDLVPGSLLKLVADREHLQPEVERLAARVSELLQKAVPKMFRKVPPKDEPDLNAKIGALLLTHYAELRSEHPLVRFACASVVPDHELPRHELLVEAKYVRTATPPSKASEGISADVTKYPADAFVLFVVLDLADAITDDAEFVRDFESVRKCKVLIIH